MSIFSTVRAMRATVYNKVWHTPKGKFSAKVRKVCDGIPRNQRLMVVGVMLCAFVLIAFLVFGNACYKIGLGHSRRIVEVEHISPIDLPSSDVKSLTPTEYDNAGMESED